MAAERQRVASGSPFEAKIGFCRALRVRDRVVVAGTAPIWPDGSCDPDPEQQARRCLEIIVDALAECGARAEHVTRTRMFLTDPVFGGAPPVATMVVVSGFLDPRWKVEIEAEATID